MSTNPAAQTAEGPWPKWNGPAWQVALIGGAGVAVISLLAAIYPIEVLGALVGIVLVVATVFRPVFGLVALFALEPFWGVLYTYFHNVRGLHFGPLTLWKDTLIGTVLVIAIIRDLWKTKRLRLPRSRMDRFVIVYVLYYLVLTVASPKLTPAMYGAARVIEGPLLMLALLYLRLSRRQLTACAVAMIGAAAIIGGAGLIEHFGPHADFQTWYGAPAPLPNSSFYGIQGQNYRSGSFLASPLTLAFYLAAAGPFALGLVMAVRSRWRLLAVLAVALCFGGLVVTVTRSGYIGGSAGAIAVLALSVRNPTRRGALAGFVIVGLGAVIFSNVTSGNQTLLRTHETHGKFHTVSADIDRIVARPIGYGLGTTDYVAQRFQVTGGGGGSSTESEFLAKAIEGGVGALASYLVLLFAVLMRLRATRRRAIRDGDPAAVALASGAIGAVIGLIGSSLFLGIEELVVEIVVWGAVGIALAYSRAPVEVEATPPRGLLPAA